MKFLTVVSNFVNLDSWITINIIIIIHTNLKIKLYPSQQKSNRRRFVAKLVKEPPLDISDMQR